MKTKTATKDDKRRFSQLQVLGCVACRIYKQRYRFADVHHLLSGGRRRGHQFSIPLCEWHHRGVPVNELSVACCERVFGPSLARTPRKFHGMFGSDEQLLSLVNALIREHFSW